MTRRTRMSSSVGCRGATLVQYAMLLALVALVAIAGISKLGGSGKTSLTTAGAGLTAGADSTGAGAGAGPAGASTSTTTIAETNGANGSTASADGNGGSGSGSTPSGGATPTTVPASTTIAAAEAAVPATTPEPAESTDGKGDPGSVWSSSKAALVDKFNWRSDVAATIYGTDGKPLTGVSAGVQIRIVQEYRTWDGKAQERSWTTQANLKKGVVSLSDTGLNTGAGRGEEVVAMRYEVTGVSYYYPSDPKIRWDGATPETRLARP